jgi:hypothetical protein
MRTLLLASALFFISWTGSASGQTAEETVLFILTGFEDGVPNKVGVISKVSSNKWTLTESGNQQATELEVRKIDSCRYDFNIKITDKKTKSVEAEVRTTYDFSKVREYSVIPSGEFAQIRILGAAGAVKSEIVDGRGQIIQREANFALRAFTPKNRLEAAYAYFRSAFCSGRAF